MKRLLCFAAALLIFLCAACGYSEEWIVVEEETAVTFRDQARFIMRNMTLEEKIYQLFFITPEALTGEKRATQINDADIMGKYPVGGIILFGQNIVSEEQVKAFTSALRNSALSSGVYPPLIAVDEEGGGVIRIANKLGYDTAPSAQIIGQTGDPSSAYQVGLMIAQYLKPLGIHLNFAPVADVLFHEESELGDRAYGNDAELVSSMALSMAQGLRAGNIIPCYKHFPGHGSVEETHRGMGSARRTLEEMRSLEWIPFQDGIDGQIEMVMTSHLIMRGTDDSLPASLSPLAIQEYLRGELGYDGVVITDALRMGAITKYYSSGEAAVMAIQAGADFILIPSDFSKAADAVFKAVQNNKISLERIEESVERILALKIQYGVIQ